MRTAVSLLVLTLAACGGGDQPAPQNFMDDPPLWNEYVVGYKETINLAESVSIEFTALEEDSRCPVDAQCVSEGNARVLLTYFTPRGTGTVRVNTNVNLPDSALFDYYGVELRKLEPHPTAAVLNGTAPVPLSAYEATVFVVKAATPP
ncbi:MAG TPA: hypothetical protein VGO61_02140 [Steroidobacteraceae bacterium]|jgi:hypothetical protein|nr:hypothetical protein [Steroidobacteraceae bacterium]